MVELGVLLARAREGSREAIDEIFALLYRDLRQLAHSRLRTTGQFTILDTTALVHESYLRLVKAGSIGAVDRPQFMAYAARVMRSIIVDVIRQRQADRRGGGATEVALDTSLLEAISGGEREILDVNNALETLARVDERLVTVVELRYFGGFSEKEIAEFLGVTERTVRRDWEKARLLLADALRS